MEKRRRKNNDRRNGSRPLCGPHNNPVSRARETHSYGTRVRVRTGTQLPCNIIYRDRYRSSRVGGVVGGQYPRTVRLASRRIRPVPVEGWGGARLVCSVRRLTAATAGAAAFKRRAGTANTIDIIVRLRFVSGTRRNESSTKTICRPTGPTDSRNRVTTVKHTVGPTRFPRPLLFYVISTLSVLTSDTQ